MVNCSWMYRWNAELLETIDLTWNNWIAQDRLMKWCIFATGKHFDCCNLPNILVQEASGMKDLLHNLEVRLSKQDLKGWIRVFRSKVEAGLIYQLQMTSIDTRNNNSQIRESRIERSQFTTHNGCNRSPMSIGGMKSSNAVSLRPSHLYFQTLPVNNFAIVNVFESQADLDEPIQDLVFWQKPFLFLQGSAKVTCV